MQTGGGERRRRTQRYEQPGAVPPTGQQREWERTNYSTAEQVALNQARQGRRSAVPERVSELTDSGVRRRHLSWLQLAGIALAAAALIAVMLWIADSVRKAQALSAAVVPYNTTYCEGVYVDGVHLGGLTQQEAREQVTAQVMLHSSWYVNLVWQGETLCTLRAGDMGMEVDIENALREAWMQGHVGNEQERYNAMQMLKENPFHAYSTSAGNDTVLLDSILVEVQNRVNVAPQDAQLIAFDADRTDPFQIQPEVYGYRADVTGLKEELYNRLSDMVGGDLELKAETIAPTVTEEWLRTNLLTPRGSASTRISTSSTENRNNNIRRAFELVAGTIIAPGQVFSFNDIVGERTIKNGFFEADEYVYEQVVAGVGGGVCQASTTIYQAAIRAGLEIVNRTPHSMSVGYTEKGKDATVYWYSTHRIDLKFKNTTDYPIYITAAVQSDSKNKSRLNANVTIYGESMGNVTYDFRVEETQIEPGEPELREDKKGEYVVYTDEQYIAQEAAVGWQVDSYRVTYVRGQAVEETFLYTDTYKPKNEIIYVGITERPPEGEMLPEESALPQETVQ